MRARSRGDLGEPPLQLVGERLRMRASSPTSSPARRGARAEVAGREALARAVHHAAAGRPAGRADADQQGGDDEGQPPARPARRRRRAACSLRGRQRQRDAGTPSSRPSSRHGHGGVDEVRPHGRAVAHRRPVPVAPVAAATSGRRAWFSSSRSAAGPRPSRPGRGRRASMKVTRAPRSPRPGVHQRVDSGSAPPASAGCRAAATRAGLRLQPRGHLLGRASPQPGQREQEHGQERGRRGRDGGDADAGAQPPSSRQDSARR